MQLELIVPAMLADCIGGTRKTFLDASTRADAITELQARFPLLVPHIYDDAGKIRKHILIYFNDESVTWLKDLNHPIQPGDRLQIIQAVSGG